MFSESNLQVLSPDESSIQVSRLSEYVKQLLQRAKGVNQPFRLCFMQFFVISEISRPKCAGTPCLSELFLTHRFQFLETSPDPEREWVNAVLKQLWPLMNSALDNFCRSIVGLLSKIDCLIDQNGCGTATTS